MSIQWRQVTFRLPVELYAELEKHARENERNINQALRHAVRCYLLDQNTSDDEAA